jgi:DNA helicase II / ATP-dependent DNA helicase PcrA
MEASLLSGLNQAQCAAVTSTAGVLQVLAPPGSGKTKTLTSRVAHLIANRGCDPSNVICCTFTIKASREMRERLRGLIGEPLESKLILGTFHSICRRYLAAYGNRIGISKGFGIADTSDSNSIVKRICKKYNLKIEPKTAKSKISWNKSRFRSPEVLRNEQAKAKHRNENQEELIRVYEEYEAELALNNLLDYDDLLLRCVDLLREYPPCVANVEALLIDEFQDTNIVQFELMKLLASSRSHITIVGDPDQSIYGFRSAEIENLKRMKAHYHDTVVINLEENYRSAAAILHLAQEVIDQDTERPDKKLKSTHCHGALPALRRLPNPYEEALWLANEVKRMMAMTGGLIQHDDVAVLLRSGYLSLLIEKAFTSSGIPYRMVGGMRFFDRAEIRLIIDYLRTISHPDNNAALLAIINTPARGIGDTAINGFRRLADEHSLSIWQVIQKVLCGNLTLDKKLKKSGEQDLGKFVNLIKRARDKMWDMEPSTVPSQLISLVVSSINLEAHLRSKHREDHEERLENIKELITHASDVGTMFLSNETLPVVQGAEQQEMDKTQESLDQFLANIVLSSEVEDKDGDAKPRVTISTIHSAKGLEWPVVFIPAVYNGSIPHSRAEDTDEERRLLYVAITRAQTLLYMSFPLLGSRDQGALDMTPFLPESLHCRTVERGPTFSDRCIADLATIMRRDVPTQTQIAIGVASLTDKESPDDDLWPYDGRPRIGPEQQLLKARQFGSEGINSNNTAGSSMDSNHWQSTSNGFHTTMGSSSSFSTAATSMNSGFTTAGQQWRTQGHTLGKTTTAPVVSKTERHEPHNRGNKASNGSGSITNFFSRGSQLQSQTTTRPPASEAAKQAWASRPATSAPPTMQSLPRTQQAHVTSSINQPSLPGPSSMPQRAPAPNASISLPGMGRPAAPGRLFDPSTTTLKRPRPLALGEVSPNRDRRKYRNLSSSPIEQTFETMGEAAFPGSSSDSGSHDDNMDSTNNMKENTTSSDVKAQVKTAASLAGKPVYGNGRPTPRNGVLPPTKKKTLGVRGAFVPWGERKHK